MSPLTCDEFESLSAEFALGVLPGDQRGLALTHLATCPSCRAQTRELARVADSLLLLSRPAEPPIGFESRVLSRIGIEAAALSRPKRFRRFRLAAAAALILAVGSAGLLTGRFTGHGGGTSHIALVRRDSGWCQVAALPGNGATPAMLIVRLDEPKEPPGSYPVQLLPANGGRPIPWGVIEVRGGHGSLQGPVPAGAGPVHGIRVFDGNDVRYTASFAPV
jgi:hypothetical protein